VPNVVVHSGRINLVSRSRYLNELRGRNNQVELPRNVYCLDGRTQAKQTVAANDLTVPTACVSPDIHC